MEMQKVTEYSKWLLKRHSPAERRTKNCCAEKKYELVVMVSLQASISKQVLQEDPVLAGLPLFPLTIACPTITSHFGLETSCAEMSNVGIISFWMFRLIYSN